MADRARSAPAPTVAPPDQVVRNPLSRTRVEIAIARSAAGFGVAFFLQAIGPLLAQAPNLRPAWVGGCVVALSASLLIAGAAALLGRFVALTAALFPTVYVLALLSWPFVAVVDPGQAPRESFWLYFLLTVATVMASIAFPLRWATLYLVVVPLVYGVIRTTPAGGGVGIDLAALDSIYAIILGGFVTIVATILRDTAWAVDRAQATALERYATAVRQHAIEAERVQVDAIVHDSVLTTLLTAARAYTAEAKEIAATMAGNAIGYLRDAVAVSPDSDAHVSGAALAGRVESAASTMSQPIRVRVADVRTSSLPLPAAEALYSAAVQAMVNSLQHAGPGVDRWVEVRGGDDGALEIEVGDAGRGFDLASVPNERLGVRVSIVERVASAGGRADVRSAAGAGTRIAMRWPDPEAQSAPSFDDIAAEPLAAEEAER